MSEKQTDEWRKDFENFKPLRTLPKRTTPNIIDTLSSRSTQLDVLFSFLDEKFFKLILRHTNERLLIFASLKKRKIELATLPEIYAVFGIVLVMCYNRLPAMRMYWSKKPALENLLIKQTMTRDRFKLLYSKLYFNTPQKPPNAGKLYYLEKVIPMFNTSFQRVRSNSTFQSIDEMMTKCKGRVGFKQYNPMKPIKRGIKQWDRADSVTGYVYDMQVYFGKGEQKDPDRTLGESVVLKSLSSIPKRELKNVSVCFDRFFSTVNLFKELKCCATGTIQRNRKNLPTMDAKLDKYGSEIFQKNGLTVSRWQDTKEVLVVSNCHKDQITEVSRKTKTGERSAVSCPEAIAFYNKYMGGVDHAGQVVSLYDFDRKSNKWWIRVFFKYLQVTTSNAFIVFKELVERPKLPFIDFLVPLSEQLIGHSQRNSTKKKKPGRPSTKKPLGDDHLIMVVDHGRFRCVHCFAQKKDLKTDTFCKACDVYLCKHCFHEYHMNLK